MITAVAAAFLAACSNELEIDQYDLSAWTTPLQVETVQPATRAGIDAGYFEQGDSIGLTLGGYQNQYVNVPARYQGSNWNFEDNVLLTSERTTVYAYYPYSADNGRGYFQLDAASQANYLYGSTSGIYNLNPTARIDFHHAMARVRLQVTYKKGVQLTALTLKGDNIYSRAVLLLEEQHLTEFRVAEEGLTIKPATSTDATQYVDVLLIPNEQAGATQLELLYANDKKFTFNFELPALAMGSYFTMPVTIKEDPYNGHEYVDFGLPSKTLWATCNVGAESPQQRGLFFAWGEVTTKEDYSYATYLWGNGSSFETGEATGFYTKYCSLSAYGHNGFTDNLTILEAADDAAYAAWHGVWRMPTKAEIQELITYCDWEWDAKNYGYSVSRNGKSIFLPAGGTFVGKDVMGEGTYGMYASSELITTNPNYAYELSFFNMGWTEGWTAARRPRQYGRTVRPVCTRQ